jgi:hypothetical protein
LRDIEALSVAIPYTDAVVTDADVANAAKPAGPRTAVHAATPITSRCAAVVPVRLRL